MLDEIRGIRDGGGFGSIMGRNSFQRPQAEALKLPARRDGHLRGSRTVSLELLSREFLRVVEEAAIAAARTMGQGERKYSDQVAVEAMRKAMDTLPMRGTVVIGEGERDEAPMLFIGEKVGRGVPERPRGRHRRRSARGHQPLRHRRAGRDRRAGGGEQGRSAARARLLHGEDHRRTGGARAPSTSMRRSRTNLKVIAKRLGRHVEDLVVIVLDRPRHEQLIEEIRSAGARIRLIADGDLSAGISAAVRGTNVHAVMGIGGAPEGVLAAAAMRCLNGGMQGRLVPTKEGQEERMRRMGISDPEPHLHGARPRARPGDHLRRVRRHRRLASCAACASSAAASARARSSCRSSERIIRFVDSVRLEEGVDRAVEF